MKLEVNVEKKWAIVISSLFVILLSSLFVLAAFNSNLPWHPLQQISPDGSSSLDDDGDNLIDEADLDLSDVYAAIGEGGTDGTSGESCEAAACSVICNGDCAPAPNGWTLTEATGESGVYYQEYAGGTIGYTVTSSGGRCLTAEGQVDYEGQLQSGTEKLCCYFPN